MTPPKSLSEERFPYRCVYPGCNKPTAASQNFCSLQCEDAFEEENPPPKSLAEMIAFNPLWIKISEYKKLHDRFVNGDLHKEENILDRHGFEYLAKDLAPIDLMFVYLNDIDRLAPLLSLLAPMAEEIRALREALEICDTGIFDGEILKLREIHDIAADALAKPSTLEKLKEVVGAND